ncbi:MAG: hypothetical protein ACT4OZ_00245 [Gemmatimonadota bacterium]
MSEPSEDDVRWLAEHATAGDEDRARWELRYARRALGLIVAQRDAMDDRTASVVAKELTLAMVADRRAAATMVKLVERQFNERLSAYRDMMQLRGTNSDMAERLGRALLMLGGAPKIPVPVLARAAEYATVWLGEANAALRAAVGEAALPPDVRPSSLTR